jgi:hypothetical protein
MSRLLGRGAGCDQVAGHKDRADQSFQTLHCRLPARDRNFTRGNNQSPCSRSMRTDHRLATGRPRRFARACHDAEGQS